MIDNFHLILIILLLQDFSSTLASWISSVMCLFSSLLFNTNLNCLKDVINIKEILLVELRGILMMDEFAKHAKLKRNIETLDKQIGLVQTRIQGRKTMINLLVQGVLPLCLHLYLCTLCTITAALQWLN